jgi:hypothetical protein
MWGKTWLAYKALAAGLTLALAVTVAGADALDPKPERDPPDPPGTATYMAQLRALFDAWDLNKDGYLDKAELAKAFRGPKARPYDYKPEKKADKKDADKDKDAQTGADKDKDVNKDKGADKDKDKDKGKDADKGKDTSASTTDKPSSPDYSKYPDYNFLVQLDQDKDGQISRKEFMSWARDYAVQLKQQDGALKRLAREQQKLANLEQKLLNAKPNSKQYQKLQKEIRAEQAAIKKMDSQMNKEVKALDKSIQKALKALKR